jgi:hypothetical protein
MTTQPNSKDKKGGLAMYLRSQAAYKNTRLIRTWSKYYMHTCTKAGNAQVHIFQLYIPPDTNKEGREAIFRHLIFALDYEIHRAAGENHVIVTGDFNREGMKDMQHIATARGYSSVPTATRGIGTELDATYVSQGVSIMHSQSIFTTHSDHALTVTGLQITTSNKWVEYQVSVPISSNELRMMLRNKENRKAMESYDAETDGPFRNKAVLPIESKKQWVTFGARPPTTFVPKGDFDPYGAARAAERINAKKALMLKLWKEKKMNKVWGLVR